jgi:hypothetical protein
MSKWSTGSRERSARRWRATARQRRFLPTRLHPKSTPSLRYRAEGMEAAWGGASDEAPVAAAEVAVGVGAAGSAADAGAGVDQGAAEVLAVAPDPLQVPSLKARSK